MTSKNVLRCIAVLALAGAAALSGCGGGGGGGGGSGPGVPPPVVDGPAWWGFGRDAQHSGLSGTATQSLTRVVWSTPVDLAPQYTTGGALLIHYGSPVITSRNTVIVPVKTGATGGFRFEARSGSNGSLLWSADSDYILPVQSWVPSYNLTLTAGGRLYAPGAGGKLLVRDNPDSATGTVQSAVFYGAAAYAAAPAAFNASIIINTPITADAQGNVFFGFIVTGTNPAGLTSGLARLAADGSGSWVAAAAAASDPAIAKVATNSAPALSPDQRTLYVLVNTPSGTGEVQGGYLLALDSTTLAVKRRASLIDPGTGTRARISDNSSASPTVGPDGQVFMGVLETGGDTHNRRGWLLQFDPTLATTRVPGGFGWDITPSIVPASMVPSYSGTSTYLLAVKYNDYADIGSGAGLNRIAVIDPGSSQTDPISGRPIMREVLTILGPTFEIGNSGPVKEWCINTMAVDPFTRSILANSEDGILYRWDMASNSFTQSIRLTQGLGEAYTPTAIGADGAVYAINNARLFSVGN